MSSWEKWKSAFIKLYLSRRIKKSNFITFLLRAFTKTERKRSRTTGWRVEKSTNVLEVKYERKIFIYIQDERSKKLFIEQSNILPWFLNKGLSRLRATFYVSRLSFNKFDCYNISFSFTKTFMECSLVKEPKKNFSSAKFWNKTLFSTLKEIIVVSKQFQQISFRKSLDFVCFILESDVKCKHRDVQYQFVIFFSKYLQY